MHMATQSLDKPLPRRPRPAAEPVRSGVEVRRTSLRSEAGAPDELYEFFAGSREEAFDWSLDLLARYPPETWGTALVSRVRQDGRHLVCMRRLSR